MGAKRSKTKKAGGRNAGIVREEDMSLEGWFLELNQLPRLSKVLVWRQMPDGRWQRMPRGDLYPPFYEDGIGHLLLALFEELGDGTYRFTPSVRGKLRGTYTQAVMGCGRGRTWWR